VRGKLKMMTEKERKIEELLTKGVEEIIEKDSLRRKLNSGRRLRIKHGVDPTTTDLHLGYAVVYEKLRQFQDLGHKVIFLIGDFTGRFGDPTDKSSTRKMRDKKVVRGMAKNYIRQATKILKKSNLEVRYNSEWFDKMSAEDLLKLMSHFTTRRILERDMFQEREKKGLEIGLHEPVYPVLQAYDSVALKADVEVGGSDQLFNCLKGRELQKKFNQPPQDVLTTKLLIGTDGKEKMSQSLGNYIGIEEKPNEQYGKVMSIPDSLIIHYFKLVTRVSLEEVKQWEKMLEDKKIPPQILKKKLAREIVSIYHGKEQAEKAEKEFNRVFKEKKLPSKINKAFVKEGKMDILDLLNKTKMASSKSEAKRLILQGGVKIDGATQKDWRKTVEVRKGMVIQVGKRKFLKIK